MQEVNLLMQQNRVNELNGPLKKPLRFFRTALKEKCAKRLLEKLPEIKKERGQLKPGEEPPLPRSHPGH